MSTDNESALPNAAGFEFSFGVPHWLVAEPPRQAHDYLSGQFSLWDRVFSTELDNGIKLYGYRPGGFIFDFAEYGPGVVPQRDPFPAGFMQALAERLKVMNLMALCLHSACITHHAMDLGATWVTKTEMFHAYNIEDNISFSGDGHPETALPDRPNEADLNRNYIVDYAAIEMAAALLKQICSTGQDAITSIGLLNEALCACRRFSVALSVVAAWTVCEKQLNLLWTRYYEQASAAHGESVSSSRRRQLEHPDYTAAIKSQVLSLAGKIPNDLRDKLDKARRSRNQWLHEIRNPDVETAQTCLEAAVEMVKLTTGVELTVQAAMLMIG